MDKNKNLARETMQTLSLIITAMGSLASKYFTK